jgi:hypothetical protein
LDNVQCIQRKVFQNLLILFFDNFAALEGRKAGEEKVKKLLKEVLLDMAVWKVLDDLYRKFLEQKPSSAPLAVLLSIL